MSRVLIISPDPIHQYMAGPGVRNWEIAHALSKYCDVTLAVPNVPPESSSVNVVGFDLKEGNIRPLAAKADVIILRGPVLHFHPYLRDLGIPIAVDLYIPDLLESLVWHASSELESWVPAYEEYLRVQLELLRAGDFFFCASEQQRDYWLGWLHAQKRLNPHTYRQDPTFRKLIDVVPFGLPSTPPQTTSSALRDVHPAIGPESKIVLWYGGIWDWLDPLTVIQAIAKLASTYPEIRLYFMGARSPNPATAAMSMLDRAIELSRSLGLYGRVVLFGNWVPYEERVNYLLEADVSVVAHMDHIETHFSFRTRVLDCIWAGLPLVITEGGEMARIVRSFNLGLTVPPQDVEAMAQAIEKILYRRGGKSAFKKNFDTIRTSLAWDKVIRPLVDFCLHPKIAPDKGQYLTEIERISRDKDNLIETQAQEIIRLQEIVQTQMQEIIRLQEFEATLIRYHRMFPFRFYFWLKRWFGRI